MAQVIQIRRDTAANWTSVNPLIADGEWGYETDTGKLKVGNGVTNWNSLSYYSPVASIAHNSTTSIQGGSLTERYHLTLAEYTNVQNIKKIARRAALIFG